jgi:hypothetical protein
VFLRTVFLRTVFLRAVFLRTVSRAASLRHHHPGAPPPGPAVG